MQSRGGRCSSVFLLQLGVGGVGSISGDSSEHGKEMEPVFDCFYRTQQRTRQKMAMVVYFSCRQQVAGQEQEVLRWTGATGDGRNTAAARCIFFPPATINFGGGGCIATTAHGVGGPERRCWCEIAERRRFRVSRRCRRLCVSNRNVGDVCFRVYPLLMQHYQKLAVLVPPSPSSLNQVQINTKRPLTTNIISLKSNPSLF